MAGGALSYTDAVRLLAGEDSRAFRLIDSLRSAEGGVTAVATPGRPDSTDRMNGEINARVGRDRH